VSILRPLKGLDTNLYENLESTFTQEYPNYEILLSVTDAHDQALPIVRELIAKYPRTRARIIIGERMRGRTAVYKADRASGAEDVGVNPKVNNLVRPYREAAHDILWVLDSNVRADPGTLGRAVDALTLPRPAGARRIALVHHVPFAHVDVSAVGSAIEAAFLNTNHARMYVAINVAALDSCVVGKSCLYRRSDIERLDGSLVPADSPKARAGPRGLPAFGRFLAEDNMLAGALWHELGARHALAPDVARNAVGRMALSDYVWRRVRWIRVRKRMVFAATMVEPLTESIALGCVAAAALRRLFNVQPALFLVAHFAWWLAVDLDVYASLAGHPLPAAGRWAFLGAWAARELLALPIWLLAIGGNEVEWRGRRYSVMRNGEVRRADARVGGGLRDEYEALHAAL
jgi:ceramide glucosyltransferase